MAGYGNSTVYSCSIHARKTNDFTDIHLYQLPFVFTDICVGCVDSFNFDYSKNRV